jgi:hypothetical protein
MIDLKDADNVVCTKALARRSGFFHAFGNGHRENVVLDEDPIGLLRPPIEITREELQVYLPIVEKVMRQFDLHHDKAGWAAARFNRKIGEWCWKVIAKQPPDGNPEPVVVPPEVLRAKSDLGLSKDALKGGRKKLDAAFHKMMRKDPEKTVRNICRDLFDLAERAAGKTGHFTAKSVLFHLRINVPRARRVIVLDATDNPELLRPLFKPRPIRVLCDERVQPAGRVIQFMDFNGPRSYLNKTPAKMVRIIDAIGKMHPTGRIVLISHKSCVEALRDASEHNDRITIAHFGALRGRNDLESSKNNPIACHIVAGSPKTTERDRQQLALAVYGKDALPFPDLVTVRRAVVGRVLQEAAEGDEERIWEIRLKGYTDQKMTAVYNHTVTAELTHASDRARVLIHRDAIVYLVTNEPCPKFWFAEMCYASEYLDLSPGPRADFRAACDRYAAEAKKHLDAGKTIGNVDVCRAMGREPKWGSRYWREFLKVNADALEGDRKVKWKDL